MGFLAGPEHTSYGHKAKRKAQRAEEQRMQRLRGSEINHGELEGL